MDYKKTNNKQKKIILDRKDLNFFNKVNPTIVIRDTLKTWAIIIGVIFIASFYKSNIILLLLTSFILGTQFYALTIIAHDGLHRRLFNKIWKNDLWNDVMILGLFGAITRINRENHIFHHQTLGNKFDPDRYKYEIDIKRNPLLFILKLSGILNIMHSFKNIYIKPNIKKSHLKQSKVSYKFRDLFIILIWQILIINNLFNIFGLKGYILFWIIPIILASSLDSIRVFCEHSGIQESNKNYDKVRLVNIKGNFFERFLLAPYNMNYHAIHHLWPTIPYYNLQKANNLISKKEPCLDSNIVTLNSYLSLIFSLWKYAIQSKEIQTKIPT